MSSSAEAPAKITSKKRYEKDYILSAIEKNLNRGRGEEHEDLPKELFHKKIKQTLNFRLAQFILVYLSLSLFIYARDEGDSETNENYSLELLGFTAAVFAIDTVTTCFVSKPELNSCMIILNTLVTHY
jgi:hypothetical protein